MQDRDRHFSLLASAESSHQAHWGKHIRIENIWVKIMSPYWFHNWVNTTPKLQNKFKQITIVPPFGGGYPGWENIVGKNCNFKNPKHPINNRYYKRQINFKKTTKLPVWNDFEVDGCQGLLLMTKNQMWKNSCRWWKVPWFSRGMNQLRRILRKKVLLKRMHKSIKYVCQHNQTILVFLRN